MIDFYILDGCLIAKVKNDKLSQVLGSITVAEVSIATIESFKKDMRDYYDKLNSIVSNTDPEPLLNAVVLEDSTTHLSNSDLTPPHQDALKDMLTRAKRRSSHNVLDLDAAINSEELGGIKDVHATEDVRKKKQKAKPKLKDVEYDKILVTGIKYSDKELLWVKILNTYR